MHEDPQAIIRILEKSLKHILEKEGFVRFPTVLISPSKRPDLCDYQCNALVAHKVSCEASGRIIADLKACFPKIDINLASPGFINFRLSQEILEESLKKAIHHTPQTSSPQTIVMDYGGPNVAKPMHVGHLRSSIIGECLKRLLRCLGHTVLADIHLGDWGSQMGMLIVGLREKKPDEVYFDETYKGPYPSVPFFTFDDLETLYPLMAQKTKEDEGIANACRCATRELQQGRHGYVALWSHFVDLSIKDMEPQFKDLGVSFDYWFGESRYAPVLESLVNTLEERRIAQRDQGSLMVFFEEKDLPPLMVQKSDGGFLYATTDLATLKERVETFKAQRIIYIVDGRQDLHFRQLFALAKKIGIDVPCTFLGFGTMNGEDNKPFKTRAGGVMKLRDLIEILEKAAFDKMESDHISSTLSLENKKKTASMIGLAALKFADLQHDPKQNYQFSLEKFMRFEGKTGPYLQYAAVRLKTLLKKAPCFCEEESWAPFLPQERALAFCLFGFEESLHRAAQNLSPNILCESAFELAQTFSRFYQECAILTESEHQTKRIFLSRLTLKYLLVYMNLLGIDCPDQM